MIAASADLLQELPLAAACAVLDLGRGSYYRSERELVRPGREESQPPGRKKDEPALREALEAVVLEFPGYGYLRTTHALRRAGWVVNPKRVYRLMQEGGWLHVRKRRRVRTTDSEHGWPVYPNLLSERGWRSLTAPDQGWGALSGWRLLHAAGALLSRRLAGEVGRRYGEAKLAVVFQPAAEGRSGC